MIGDVDKGRPKALSAVKQALLARRLRERQGASFSSPIPKRNGDPAPLAYAQEPLWVVEQRSPGLALYHITIFGRLVGPLDAGMLERALAAVIARHESLRTTFAQTDGDVYAIVHSEMPVPLARIDLADGTLSLPEREIEARRLLSSAAAEPFDLERGPLLRTTLVTLGEREHLLLITVHHIVFDGGSMRVLLRELDACYTALLRAEPIALPPVLVQYGDFAAWQRSDACAERRDAALAYWHCELEGAPQTLSLPTDRPRGAAPSAAASRRRSVIPAKVLSDLKEVAKAHDATLFMVLLAAFQALLHRYSGDDDFVVGSPIGGRVRRELEHLIGYVVNPVPLRARFSADITFARLLEDTRKRCLAAFEHHDVPYELLLHELRGAGSLGTASLSSVMFVLQDGATNQARLGEAELQLVAFDGGATPFDLVLTAAEQSDGLRASLQYRTDLFDAATADRMLAHFVTLLHAVCDDPTRIIAQIPLLSEDERHEMLVRWNDTGTDYGAGDTIDGAFAAQVRRTPGAVAVAAGDAQLTYRELDQRANRLAHELVSRGVRQGDVVAVCVERSLEMVVATLAVLKAGGAYLPLDPEYPQERLAYMLGDANARVVVTQSGLTGRLQELGLPVALVAADASRNAQPSTPPPSSGHPGDVAYVMYTSGSTGRPKGVMVPHRAVLRLVRNTNYVRIEAEDVMAQVSSFSFDALTFELWGALLHGARVEIIPRLVTLSPHEFARELERKRISLMFLTAALFRQMSREVPAAFAHMRCLIAGGEALDPVSVEAVLKHGPPRHLLNGYGPTETTTFACTYEITAVRGEGIPIGRPIANTEAYVLDAALNPVPIGVAGQLYIGGPGLALGYLNDPDQTARKFIPHPFRSGERLYATGDVVRYLADGNIEFIGRSDNQVKIRGFRVELGEVEAALLSLPSMRNATVIARREVGTDSYLVAYCVDDARPVRRTEELRAALSEVLPAYLVPRHFVQLEALPLTANGKVDRAALPVPDDTAELSEASPNPPRTELQAAVGRVVEEVLGHGGLGVDTDFFDVGGHSLDAMRVVARVEKLFRARVPLRTFFERPTIADLATVVEACETKPGQAAAIARALATMNRMTPDERARRLQAVKHHE